MRLASLGAVALLSAVAPYSRDSPSEHNAFLIPPRVRKLIAENGGARTNSLTEWSKIDGIDVMNRRWGGMDRKIGLPYL